MVQDFQQEGLFGKRKIVKDPRQMTAKDLSHVLKENHPSKNVTILKDINDKRICRIERNFSSLEKGISLDNQLKDIKRFKQDKETEICFYSPIALLHKHRHIVQTFVRKTLIEKIQKKELCLKGSRLINMHGLTV